jgi:eukaryotic-like serine/threonine-protein kinase
MTVGLDDSNPPGELYCPTCEKTYGRGDRCPDDGTRLVRLASGPDTLIGRELEGRYTIVQQLGQGGMGTVYRGTQHSVGRDVAIKVVLPKLVADSVTIKRFLRESKLSSRLSHPNAVSVLDFGQTHDGLFYLVMELVSGRTLDAILAKETVLKPERVVRIATQICDALEGAHQLQIVHRDLKPANVMLLSTGRDLVKVLDFGLAKSLTPDAKSTLVTNEGQLLGTPAFMPPELVTGMPCDGRADLYSLGVIMYRALSGRLPFTGNSAHEIIAMHVAEPPKPLAGIPVGLAAVVDRLLAKDPDHRYQNAAQAREALEDSLESTELSEAPDPTVVTPPKGTMLGWDATSTPPTGTPSLSIPRPASKRAPLPPIELPPEPVVPPPGPSSDELEAAKPTILKPGGIEPVVPSGRTARGPGVAGSTHRGPSGPVSPPRVQPVPLPRELSNTAPVRAEKPKTPAVVYVIMVLALLVIAGAIAFALAR